MDQQNEKRILRNLDYISNSISNITSLCVTLVAKDCLTINEFQIIRGQLSDEQKCMELFTRLMKKHNVFESLLEALEESGNEHVARKLQQPTAEELKSTTTRIDPAQEIYLKSRVTNDELDWIENIMCEVDYTYWSNFMRRLLKFDTKVINEIEKACKTEPHSECVHKTLTVWINGNGDAATMDNLIKALRESNLNYAADTLMTRLSSKISEDL